MTIKIDVYTDFLKCKTQMLGGRTIEHGGPYSGEEFRQQFLEPLFEDRYMMGNVEINFNSTYVPTSFLIGAFGFLAQKYGETVLERVNVISDEEPYLHEESLIVMKKGLDGEYDQPVENKQKYTACRDCQNLLVKLTGQLCGASKRPKRFDAYSGEMIDLSVPFMYIHEVNKGNCYLFKQISEIKK